MKQQRVQVDMLECTPSPTQAHELTRTLNLACGVSAGVRWPALSCHSCTRTRPYHAHRPIPRYQHDVTPVKEKGFGASERGGLLATGAVFTNGTFVLPARFKRARKLCEALAVVLLLNVYFPARPALCGSATSHSARAPTTVTGHGGFERLGSTRTAAHAVGQCESESTSESEDDASESLSLLDDWSELSVSSFARFLRSVPPRRAALTGLSAIGSSSESEPPSLRRSSVPPRARR
eukprot:scaffold220000_cov24-Tisochrysis_lutea.AAC.3